MKDQIFELNGKTYRTTKRCLSLLRKYRNDSEVFGTVFYLASQTGTIEEVK